MKSGNTWIYYWLVYSNSAAWSSINGRWAEGGIGGSFADFSLEAGEGYFYKHPKGDNFNWTPTEP